MLPPHRRFVIIGAGIHGLATAWRLAALRAAKGTGDGRDVLVLDKTGIGAGASGIACGVVRNNYFQPAMRELMAHCVDVWESDPDAFGYHPVGYLQISPESMRADVAGIHDEQRRIGYPSTFIDGAAESRAYLRRIFGDWRAQGITSVLHEHRGGYANNMASVVGLAAKAQALGVEIATGPQVLGLRIEGGAVAAVETDRGEVACDHLVVAVGPWVRDLWAMLGLPDRVAVGHPGQLPRSADPNPDQHRPDQPMWRYWSLQEGTLAVDPGFLTAEDGSAPPVVHVDSDAPLIDDIDGTLITDRMWGIYYKPDPSFGGVQGGAMPLPVDQPAADVAVDPYGPASPDFVVGPGFRRMWTSALAHCHERFAGLRGAMSPSPSGGIGCFTPDSFPVFDVFRDNAYVIADSNHGYKMLGVGDLVAKELLGDRQPLLEPFRFDRYRTGALHPVSNSPFPWS